VLYGAELSAADCDLERFSWKVSGRSASHGTRQYAALRTLLAAGQAFSLGKPAPTLAELGRELKLPHPLLEQILEPLVNRGLLARIARPGDTAYLPARALERIRLSELLRDLEPENAEQPVRSALDATARNALEEHHEKCLAGQADPTLEELVLRLDDPQKLQRGGTRLSQPGANDRLPRAVGRVTRPSA
jgi:DNA-binding IscR family transcriptional regulator